MQCDACKRQVSDSVTVRGIGDVCSECFKRAVREVGYDSNSPLDTVKVMDILTERINNSLAGETQW